VQYKIEPCGAFLKAEMTERDTAEETSEFVSAILDALRSYRIFKVLISIRSSRPVFKVEEWNLSAALEQVVKLSGLKVAFIADTKEIGMSQEYIALLAQQRGLAFRTFNGEKAAVGWLLEEEPQGT
jgi:hypothetical protein